MKQILLSAAAAAALLFGAAEVQAQKTTNAGAQAGAQGQVCPQGKCPGQGGGAGQGQGAAMQKQPMDQGKPAAQREMKQGGAHAGGQGDENLVPKKRNQQAGQEQPKRNNQQATGNDNQPRKQNQAAQGQPKQNNEQATGDQNQPRKKNQQAKQNNQNEPKTTGSIEINNEQRTTIKQTIIKHSPRRVAHVDFDINVGVAIPHTVELQPLPPTIVEIVPAYRHYDYFVLADGRIVIVDPNSWQIVYIIA